MHLIIIMLYNVMNSFQLPYLIDGDVKITQSKAVSYQISHDSNYVHCKTT